MASMPASRAIALAAVLGLALGQSCFYPVEDVLDAAPEQHGASGSGGSLSVNPGGESEGCNEGERCVPAKNVVVLTDRAEFCTTLALEWCDPGTCGCQASSGNTKDAECTEQLSRPDGECGEWVGANNTSCTPTQAREFAAARSYVAQQHNVNCTIQNGTPARVQREYCRFDARPCKGNPDSVCVTQKTLLLLPGAFGVACPVGYESRPVFLPQEGVGQPSCTCACEKCSAAEYRLYSQENCTDEWPMLIEADRGCQALPRTATRYKLMGYRKCRPYADMPAANRMLCTPIKAG